MKSKQSTSVKALALDQAQGVGVLKDRFAEALRLASVLRNGSEVSK